MSKWNELLCMDILLLHLIKNFFFKKKLDELIYIKKYVFLYFLFFGGPTRQSADPWRGGAGWHIQPKLLRWVGRPAPLKAWPAARRGGARRVGLFAITNWNVISLSLNFNNSNHELNIYKSCIYLKLASYRYIINSQFKLGKEEA